MENYIESPAGLNTLQDSYDIAEWDNSHCYNQSCEIA